MGWSLTRIRELFRRRSTKSEGEIEAAETIGDEKAVIEPESPDVMLISVIGLEASKRERMLDWMIEDCSKNGKVPVFLTDDLDLSPWLKRELVVEHLPSMERQSTMAPDLDWDLYLKRRLDFLKRKWRVGHIVDLGQSLDQLGQADRSPPIEIDRARRVIGSR